MAAQPEMIVALGPKHVQLAEGQCSKCLSRPELRSRLKILTPCAREPPALQGNLGTREQLAWRREDPPDFDEAFSVNRKTLIRNIQETALCGGAVLQQIG